MAAPVPAAERSRSHRLVPAEQPARGLVYDGLRRDPSGPCGDLFQVARPGRGPAICTHGPDPAPGGFDVRTRTPRLTSPDDSLRATDQPPSAPIPCVGNGTSGPRVHAMYAVASDVTDRYDQVVQSIRGWAQAVEGIVQQSAAQTGGSRGVRWLTQPTAGGCELVVEHVVMGPAGDDDFSRMIEELRLRGYIRADRRYLVWVDANVLCGIGSAAIDDSAGIDNGNNGRVPLYSRIDTGCWGLLDKFSSGPNFVSVEAHELMHNFGAVQESAPHSTDNGHCFDEWDAMCYDDDTNPATFPLQMVCPNQSDGPLLDCNDDDYFHTNPPPNNYLATHWNPADAVFFTGSPFPETQRLTVVKSGTGSGGVVGELFGINGARQACQARGLNCDWADEVGDVGIDCGPACSSELSTNLTVTLIPTPGANAAFGGWTGDCLAIAMGTDANGNQVEVCHVRMNRARTVNARFAGPGPQPDLIIGRPGGRDLVGDNIYNSTGSQQSRSGSVKRGKSTSFEVRVENDSANTDSIRLKGTGNSKDFTVTYFSGKQNITSFMVGGQLQVSNIPPSAFASFKVVVKAKSSAGRGDKTTVKVTATSQKDTSKVDVVKAPVKVS